VLVATQYLSMIDDQSCSSKQWSRIRAERVQEKIVENFEYCGAKLWMSVTLLCDNCCQLTSNAMRMKRTTVSSMTERHVLHCGPAVDFCLLYVRLPYGQLPSEVYKLHLLEVRPIGRSTALPLVSL
jgi:hypothetical protein